MHKVLTILESRSLLSGASPCTETIDVPFWLDLSPPLTCIRMDDPTQTIPPIQKKKKKKKKKTKRAFENCQIGYEIRKLGLPKNML